MCLLNVSVRTLYSGELASDPEWLRCVFVLALLTPFALSNIAVRPLVERNVGIYNYEACPESIQPF
jgi:hypothetical protein